LECNNFYRLAVLKQGATTQQQQQQQTTIPFTTTTNCSTPISGQLDNLDGRITSDICEFANNVALLYGHSFKPILEFFLSLWEASKVNPLQHLCTTPVTLL
jgi:hypothetical protein